jgi:hypothetical protein
MSEPFIGQSKRTGRSRGLIFLILLGGILFALVAAILVFMFLNRDSTPVQAPDMPLLGPKVSIVLPNTEIPLNDRAPVVIAAEAVSDSPIKNLELYVDGVLQGVQAAPLGTGNYFSANFFFSAPEVGIYSLIAEARDENQHVGVSDPVALSIDVDEIGAEDDNQEPDNFGTPVVDPPAPTGATSPAAMPGSNQPLGPGTPFVPPPQNGANQPATPQSAPAAPTLFVAQDSCNFVINIQDLSDNEDGFSIYRSDGQNGFIQVDSLAGQSALDWITYSDNAQGELLTYYVTAFNQAGAVASNPEHVSTNLLECPPIVTGQLPSVFIQLDSLVPETPVEQGYCYRSFDSAPFVRWPDSGYFEFSGSGNLSDGEIVSILLENLDGNSTPKTLHLACWSWDGSQAEYLGDVYFDPLDFENGAKKTIKGIGLDASLIYGIWDINLPGGPFPVEELPFQLELFDDFLPKADALIDYDFETCKAYLPPGTSEAIKNVSCQPYLEYTDDFPQPYLLFSPYCSFMTKCVEYEEWLVKEENGEGKFGFRIHETSPVGSSIHNVSAPYRWVDLIQYKDCHISRSFQVQTWFDPVNGPLLYGPLTKKIPLPICIDDVGLPPIEMADYRFLEITFSTFEVTDLDDGTTLGIVDSSLEMYGHLFINNASYPFDFNVVPPENLAAIQNYLRSGGAHTYSLLNLGKWGYEQYGAHWETENSNIHYPAFLTDEKLAFIEDWSLCESNVAYPCEIWALSPSASQYKESNNVLRILVTPNKPFVIGANIWDSDSSSDHDLVCNGTTTFLGGDLTQIDALDGVSFSLENDGDSGFCRIHGSIAVLMPSSQ